jgi:hypothetical protein
MARRRRILFASIVLLVIVECTWFLFSGSVEWSLRNLGFDDAQRAINARTALADFAWAVVNVIGLLEFVARRRGFGLLLLVAVQVFNAADTAYGGLLSASDGYWDTAVFRWVIMVVPAAVVVLVLWHGRVDANSRRGNESPNR